MFFDAQQDGFFDKRNADIILLYNTGIDVQVHKIQINDFVCVARIMLSQNYRKLYSQIFRKKKRFHGRQYE